MNLTVIKAMFVKKLPNGTPIKYWMFQNRQQMQKLKRLTGKMAKKYHPDRVNTQE